MKTTFLRRPILGLCCLLLSASVFLIVDRAQSQGTPANPSQKVVNRPNKIKTKTEEDPFAGLSTRSSEEIAKELDGKTNAELLQAGQRLSQARLYADASVVYERVMFSSDATDEDVCQAASSFHNASYHIFSKSRSQTLLSTCQKLEQVAESRADSWRVIYRIAQLLDYPTVGRMIDGEFVYVDDWNPDNLNSEERNRVRVLQYYAKALPLVRAELDKAQQAQPQGADPNNVSSLCAEATNFYLSFVSSLGQEYWRLQTLTDLENLPDYESDDQRNRASRTNFAPVDANGDPIFFARPESYETAKNDGERRLALFTELERRCGKYGRRFVLNRLSDEASRYFGVQTLANYDYFTNNDAEEEDALRGVWSLQTLKDNETIARLAGGVKRFELPEDYDYLAMYKELNEYADSPFATSYARLAEEYKNRRQFDKAAEALRALIVRLEQYVQENEGYRQQLDNYRRDLSAIVDPTLRLSVASSRVQGVNASLTLKYRNAKSAEFVARKVDVDALIDQVRTKEFWSADKMNRFAYFNTVEQRVLELLRRQVAEENVNSADENTKQVAQQILDQIKPDPEGLKLLGEEVARFNVELTPDPDHFACTREVEFPVHEHGVYLLEVTAQDGNTDYALVCLNDRAIVQRLYEDGARYFVVDAATGEPQQDVEVEFTRIVSRSQSSGNQFRQWVDVDGFTKTTDESGSVLLDDQSTARNISGTTRYLAVVRSKDPKDGYVYTNLEGLYRFEPYNVERFEQRQAYFISDRPVYRPNQTAKFTFWLGDAKYDAPEDKNLLGNQQVQYKVISPSGEEVALETVTTDAYGAASGEFQIPADAKLGVYVVELARDWKAPNVEFYGSGMFRLEEYRKPEYQVTVEAPKEPVALGDKFKATVSARYYFGAPVTKATVSYKVTRQRYTSTYYPARYWDWFYGCGYWQFTYDCPWYPGWLDWGCRRLHAPEFDDEYGMFAFGRGYPIRSAFGVPEVVVEGEAELNDEGKFEFEIDSALAKELFPNDDQEYSITAEVVDQSRRTIVGSGKTYAARRPFKTYAWFERGYYKVDDKMTARFQTRRIDGKPVVGKGVVKLYRVQYEPQLDENGLVVPRETEVFSQEVATDDKGCGSAEIVAAAPGQYRLSCVVETENGLREEGGQLIVVRGVKQDASATNDYRFSELEIAPDKPEYKVGDVAHIQIASKRQDAYVLLAIRPYADAAAGKPQFVRLNNGTAYVDVPIEVGDQPNFFVQATTVFDGKTYNEQKELVVPPEKRVLDVAVEPAKDRVKPGEKATVKLRLADPDGKPIVGETVVAVYDQSLDAIAAPTFGDVREFFWKWRRHASMSVRSTTNRPCAIDAFSCFVDPAYPTLLRRLERIGLFDYVSADVQTDGMSINGMGGMGGMGGMKMARRNVFGRARMRAEADFDDAFEDVAVCEEAEESAPVALDALADAAPMEAPAAMAAMAAPAMAMGKAEAKATNFSVALDTTSANVKEADANDAPLVEATVRKNFADVAYWATDLKSDDDGVVEIELDMPENLTTWKIAAWSIAPGLRVGSGEASIVTSKDLIVRMQKPRFLTQKDEVVFSANVHNYLDEEKTVQVSLEFPQDAGENSTASVALLDPSTAVQKVVVPSNGESRVDWTARAETPGVVTLLMKALTNEESDAIQDTISVKEHGVSKQVAFSGLVPKVKPAELDFDQAANKETIRESRFTLTVPEERRKETTKLTVRFSPTLAGAIFDALPYLSAYPYGCTEQTLNKFLPMVLAQHAMLESGVDLAALKEKRVNLNAQELGDAQERAKQWKKNPDYEAVFDVDEVRQMTALGVKRLQEMQCADGGWGWFSGYGERSTVENTTLVLHGLLLARECDQVVDSNAIARAHQWLLNYERQETQRAFRGLAWSDEKKRENHWNLWKSRPDDRDARVYELLSELDLAAEQFDESFVDYETGELRADLSPSQIHSVMKELIWGARDDLQLYPLACYANALAKEPNLESDDELKLRLETILRRFAQYRAEDAENQTVWLELDRVDGWFYWLWNCGEFETQATYLRLLQRVDEKTLTKLGVQNDAPRLVKYLLNNRKNATYWNSTRDTANCVEAFVEYLANSNELAPKEKVEILVDGEVKKTVEYTPENVFLVDGTLELNADQLSSGEHEVVLRVVGGGPLYYNAYLEYFTLEDPIEKTGLELKTERSFYKLVERKDATAIAEGARGQVLNQRVERYDRVPLKSGDEIVSGDLIEVELTVDSKNDYESILLEDAKAAGFEPVEQRSGYNGNSLGAYVEYRDDRVCFFVSRLPQGRSYVSYKLRAETPGKFSALPAKIWAMYAPELKGNADEFKANVLDKE